MNAGKTTLVPLFESSLKFLTTYTTWNYTLRSSPKFNNALSLLFTQTTVKFKVQCNNTTNRNANMK